MTLYYNGGVEFSRPITEEQQAHVKGILEREGLLDAQPPRSIAHLQKNGIYFEDSWGPEDAIREIQEYLANSTENPVELHGELSYYGDYEGGMIVTPESIEGLDPGPFYVRVDASDEELIAELVRRGYAVTKKEKEDG